MTTGESSQPDSNDVGLRERLLEQGIAVAREHGPHAVSLRDIQRRAGVSNTAAYRHYADRDALLQSVAAFASAQLATHMEAAARRAMKHADPATAARNAFRATGKAYIDFAAKEPGLFLTAFLPEASNGPYDDPRLQARSASGFGPFQIVEQRIDALVEAGVLDPGRKANSALSAWSAVHGMATLLLQGPLLHLPHKKREAAVARLLDIIEQGTV